MPHCTLCKVKSHNTINKIPSLNLSYWHWPFHDIRASLMETDPNSNNFSTVSTPATSNDAIILLNLPIATKLTKNNYPAWQSQIILILHGYGLYRYLVSLPPSHTVTTTIGDHSTSHLNNAYLSWHKQDQLLLGWLRSSLSEQILVEVVSSKNSKELWQMLQGSFSATSRARQSELHRRLQTITKEGLNCSDYLYRIREIADELAFIGSLVSEEDPWGLNPFMMHMRTQSFHALYGPSTPWDHSIWFQRHLMSQVGWHSGNGQLRKFSLRPRHTRCWIY